MKNQKNNLDNLEGRLIILSGHSDSSRKMAEEIYKVFEQDHEMGKRAIRINVNRLPYTNGDQNFEIKDPNNQLSIDEIKYLIKNGDTYFVNKLENPLQADPLKYKLDPLIDELGREYSNLKLTIKNSDVFKKDFISYITSNIPIILKGVVKKKILDKNIIDIGDYLTKIFKSYNKEIMEVFKDANHKGQVNLNDEKLDLLKDTISGYLYRKKIIEECPKQIFYDELREISERIGQEILTENDYGRLNWITPWLDGRSDHHKVNPYEGVRIKSIAKLAKGCNVENIHMIRGHSKKQIDYMENDGLIKINNLTQTNEYISLLGQDFNDFKDFYILSPDEGGIADAMVFARELYRRTNGEFSGRVVVFNKKRVKAGKISEMEFKASYIYKQNKEKKEDLELKKGKIIPYDKLYAETFKNPKSENYIKNLFTLEFGSDKKLPIEPTEKEEEKLIEYNTFIKKHKENQKTEEKKLIKKIKTHHAVIRDDIVASAGTIYRSSLRAHNKYKSIVTGLIEHASLTGDAITKLNYLYNQKVLDTLYTSTSIVHPGNRPWHIARSMTNRFKGYMKNDFMPWLKNNNEIVYNRLTKHSVKKK